MVVYQKKGRVSQVVPLFVKQQMEEDGNQTLESYLRDMLHWEEDVARQNPSMNGRESASKVLDRKMFWMDAFGCPPSSGQLLPFWVASIYLFCDTSPAKRGKKKKKKKKKNHKKRGSLYVWLAAGYNSLGKI